jgi:uncharacterized protein
MDMALTAVLHRRPLGSDRPDWRALLDWLKWRSLPGAIAEAWVFDNVAPDATARKQAFHDHLRRIGYQVFPKPKVGDSDIDQDILNLIEQRLGEGDLAEVILLSHDRRAFLTPLRELVARRVRTMVLGFPERAGRLAKTPGIAFVDLRRIPGVFPRALPRRSGVHPHATNGRRAGRRLRRTGAAPTGGDGSGAGTPVEDDPLCTDQDTSTAMRPPGRGRPTSIAEATGLRCRTNP